MLVRVVDYVANEGGGLRFAVEMIRALLAATPAHFEMLSTGLALERYRELLREDERVSYRDVPHLHPWRARVYMAGIPGAGPLNRLLKTGRFSFDVPSSVFDGCDAVWFPWVHRHHVPRQRAGSAVGSLHDVIGLDFDGILTTSQRREESDAIASWLSSEARVVVSSNATAARLEALFRVPRHRVAVVPLSGVHRRPAAARADARWPFERGEYILAPLNLVPHKNCEVLLSGVGLWGAKHPLVLTGSMTDLWSHHSARASKLLRTARSAGLVRGDTLFGLGCVPEATYFSLLDSAWALVMPSLAEGGGSFPAWEAILAGIPVVCSDIPVMREMMDRVGASVVWFDPRSAEDLALKLTEVERHHPALKAASRAQVTKLRRRTWIDVAEDYAKLLGVPFERSGAHRQP